jgi:hypothetical protein
MKNKIRFAFFLVSRFKGQTLEIIGIGILSFIFLQLHFLRSISQIYFIIDNSLIFISAVLIFVGEWLRRKSGTKQTLLRPT